MVKIKEGIAGHWHYHLALEKEYKSFCGKDVMNTELQLSQWGVVTKHIKETYCEKCFDIAKRKGLIK